MPTSFKISADSAVSEKRKPRMCSFENQAWAASVARWRHFASRKHFASPTGSASTSVCDAAPSKIVADVCRSAPPKA